jgi:hypothetical protein
MSSSLYNVRFDHEVVREEVNRVLAQTFEQDEKLIWNLGGFDVYVPSTPAHSKALAILLVLQTYSHEWMYSIGGGVAGNLENVAHQTLEQDLATIDALYGRDLIARFRPKLIKVEAMAQILQQWKCVP